jgi:colanic acid/amylovoran biosynthesis glycosyltransferase
MKIGIVLSSTPAYSETFFISKIKGLQKNGFEVILFVNNQKDVFTLCEVKKQVRFKSYHIIFALINLFILFIIKYKTVKKYIRLERTDGVRTGELIKKLLINQHIVRTGNLDWIHFGFATLAIGKENIAKSIGSKMAVSLRGFDIGIYPLKHPNCYELLWRKLDKLHVISTDLLNLASKNGFIKNAPYQKITPAIDVSFFQKDPLEITLFPKKNNFMTVGRLHWKKDYESILLALKILDDKGIDFTYTIIGNGVDTEKLKYMAYDLGLVDAITFKGRIPQKEIIECFKQNNLYLQYSIQEGFCNAVLEAQAMGVLPIVSDAEGLSENVLNNQTGWVVPKNNPRLLAEKIEEVLRIPENIKDKMRDRAIKRVKTEFNIEKQEQEFVNFYKE